MTKKEIETEVAKLKFELSKLKDHEHCAAVHAKPKLFRPGSQPQLILQALAAYQQMTEEELFGIISKFYKTPWGDGKLKWHSFKCTLWQLVTGTAKFKSQVSRTATGALKLA